MMNKNSSSEHYCSVTLLHVNIVDVTMCLKIKAQGGPGPTFDLACICTFIFSSSESEPGKEPGHEGDQKWVASI